MKTCRTTKRNQKSRLLETELYAHWLDELDYVVDGLKVCKLFLFFIFIMLTILGFYRMP